MGLEADKAKPSRSARVVIDHDFSADYLPEFLKCFNEQIVSELIPKVLHVDVGKSLVVSQFLQAVLAADELAHKP